MTGFHEYLNRANVGVDNLGDPSSFDVFYGLPGSSAPTHYDEYLNQANVGVDNLGDPLSFDVFYGLPRSSLDAGLVGLY